LAELDQALEALTAIVRLRDEGRGSFDSSDDRRWALAFLWVTCINDTNSLMVLLRDLRAALLDMGRTQWCAAGIPCDGSRIAKRMGATEGGA